MDFRKCVEVVFLAAMLLTGAAAIGAESERMGERCALMSLMHTVALIVLLLF